MLNPIKREEEEEERALKSRKTFRPVKHHMSKWRNLHSRALPMMQKKANNSVPTTKTLAKTQEQNKALHTASLSQVHATVQLVEGEKQLETTESRQKDICGRTEGCMFLFVHFPSFSKPVKPASAVDVLAAILLHEEFLEWIASFQIHTLRC